MAAARGCLDGHADLISPEGDITGVSDICRTVGEESAATMAEFGRASESNNAPGRDDDTVCAIADDLCFQASDAGLDAKKNSGAGLVDKAVANIMCRIA